ncbi:MAG: hypothetical protein V4467_01635 [Patescibacteria group bacterium]
MASLWYALFSWDVPTATHQELATAHAIVTQAHGRMRNGSAGPGNRIMANVTRLLHYQFPHLPIMPQEDVALADPTLPYYTVIGGLRDTRCFMATVAKKHNTTDGGSATGASNMQWNTHAIARAQAEICKQNGWTRIIVVAFPIHWGRAAAVYRKLGLTPLMAEMPADLGAYMHPYLIPSGLLGIQTVSKFRKRELLCRILFWLKNWI